LTGFSRISLFILEQALLFNEANQNIGRPSSLDDRDQLVGLFSFFVGCRMRLKDLFLIFGTVPSTASVCINKL
jgi:hypothetical protein